jgi:hypothetical protein
LGIVFADGPENTTTRHADGSPAARWVARRFGLPFPVASTLAALAGLGGAAC